MFTKFYRKICSFMETRKRRGSRYMIA
uniref:Uncharacterized protein n=1 Tax=Arundo donax TaxID=35708 RepID=A0A0A8ZG37_ARUDO